MWQRLAAAFEWAADRLFGPGFPLDDDHTTWPRVPETPAQYKPGYEHERRRVHDDGRRWYPDWDR